MDFNNSYIISLDAIDMNFLPITNQRDYNNIIPLWENRCCRDKEYFQFEIKENKSDNEENEEHNTMCYICNLEISKIFITDHNKSKKHLVNQQIAITASERLKNHFEKHEDIDQTGFDNSHYCDIYFCPECAVVVNLKDKIAHERLESHKNSVKIEKLSETFYCLYSNNRNGDESDVYCNENNMDALDTIEDSLNINDEYTDLESSISQCKEDSKYNQDLLFEQNLENNKDIKVYDDNNNLVDSEKSIFNSEELKEYINDLNNTNVNITNGDYVEIALNDAKIVVKYENYLGIKYLKGDMYVCVICRFSIYDKSTMRQHLVSDNHLKAMSVAIMDENCVRQISSVLLHCVICNNNVYLSSIHINSNIHQNLLQKALNLHFGCNEKGLNQVSYESDKTNKNEISDEPKRETPIEEIINLESSNDQIEESVEKIKPVKHVRKNKYLLKVKKEKYESDDNDDNIADFGKLMSNECFVTKQNHFCTSCNIEVSVTNIESHANCTKHLLNMKSDYHYMMSEVDNKLLCKICHVYVPNNAEAVSEHCNYEDHFSNYNDVLNTNKIILQDNIFRCSICKVEFLLKHELMHIEGKKHRQLKEVNISSTKDGYYCYICEINVSNNGVDIQKHLKSITHTKKVESKHSLQPLDFIRCKVCNVEVFNSERGRTEHRRDISHQMNYRKKLADEKVFWRQNRYYCFACTIYIDGQALNHIEDQNHKACLKDLDDKMNGFASSCKTM